MQNIKMPLNTLRKDRSKHFSGSAARLASCLPVYSDHVNKSRFLIAPLVHEKQVLSDHLKLTNKNIMFHVSETKTRNLIGCL